MTSMIGVRGAVRCSVRRGGGGRVLARGAARALRAPVQPREAGGGDRSRAGVRGEDEDDEAAGPP